MAKLEGGIPPIRSRYEIGMLFQASSILGTPPPTDWKAFGVDPKGLLGVLGKPVLPHFQPKGEGRGAKTSGVKLIMSPEFRVRASDAVHAAWLVAASGAQ